MRISGLRHAISDLVKQFEDMNSGEEPYPIRIWLKGTSESIALTIDPDTCIKGDFDTLEGYVQDGTTPTMEGSPLGEMVFIDIDSISMVR